MYFNFTRKRIGSFREINIGRSIIMFISNDIKYRRRNIGLNRMNHSYHHFSKKSVKKNYIWHYFSYRSHAERFSTSCNIYNNKSLSDISIGYGFNKFGSKYRRGKLDGFI